MKKCTASRSSGPEATAREVTVPDPLTELLRKGTRDLMAKAVEAENELPGEAVTGVIYMDGIRVSGLSGRSAA
ncbi:MAG: hypothetical protein KA342_04455 [Aminivibrio sp.]|jgi:hypothetical protein|nr:hypothetical protein [Aminivibrio sp.]